MSQSMTLQKPFRVPSTDGRSADARARRRTREALIAHVGRPSATQKELIDRAVHLHAKIVAMDQQFMATAQLDHAAYATLTTAYTGLLAQLGLGAAERVAA